MLNDCIRNLKKTVPAAFSNDTRHLPWEMTKPEIIDLRRFYPESSAVAFPPIPIVVETNTEILKDNKLEDEIAHRGIEALARYLSFHLSSNWGIFIRVRGLIYLSQFFKANRTINERMRNSMDLLFHHEYFHFLTDMAAANIEMIHKSPIYRNYLACLNTAENIEEPLANVYALTKIPRKNRAVAEAFFKTQPNPYNLYSNYLSVPDFARGKREIGSVMAYLNDASSLDQVQEKRLEIRLSRSTGSFPDEQSPFWEFLFNIEPEAVFKSQIPIFLVFEDHVNGSLQFQTPIMHDMRIAVYPNDHQPPHLHVWIPADARKEGTYEYPSLEPYRKSKSLSSRKRRLLLELIEQHKEKIDEVFKKQATTI